MAKIFGIRKRSWKRILTVGVTALLIVGAIAFVAALFGRDTETISSLEFKRGSIGADGKSVESVTSIYTKEAFPCQGLRIVPDFEATGTFDVFYYDVNDRLLGAVKGKSEVYEGDFPGASTARVVYTPAVPEGEKASEWSIGLLEVTKYARQLKITVDRKQTEYKSSTDLFVGHATAGNFADTDISAIVSAPGYQASELVKVDGKYDYYRVYVKYTSQDATKYETAVMFGDADNKAFYIDEDGKTVKPGVAYSFDNTAMIEGSWYSVTVEVPEGATSLRIYGPSEAEFRIYGVELK